jgi:hypothetical protein
MLQSNSSIKRQHKWSDGPTTITMRIGSTQHHNNGIALTTIVQPGKNTAFKQTLADCMQSISRIQSVKLPFQHFYSRDFFSHAHFWARQSHLLCLGFSQFTMVPRAPIIASVLATSSLLSPWPILMGQLPILPLGRDQSPANNLYGSADLHASGRPSGLPVSWSSPLAL